MERVLAGLAVILTTVIVKRLIIKTFVYLRWIFQTQKWLRSFDRPNPSWWQGDLKILLYEYRTGNMSISESYFQGLHVLHRDFGHMPIMPMYTDPFHPFAIIFDFDIAKAYLNVEYTDRTMFTSFLKSFLGNGLLTISGEKWTTKRRMLSHTFHSKLLVDFVPTFNRLSKELVDELTAYFPSKREKLEYATIQDLCDHMSTFSIHVLLETIIGIDSTKNRHLCARYAKDGEDLVRHVYERSLQPWLWPDWLFALTSKGSHHARFAKFAKPFAKQLIEQTLIKSNLTGKDDCPADSALPNTESSNERQSDPGRLFEPSKKRVKAFLNCLLEQNKNIDSQEVIDEMNTFLAAGHHTVSIALVFIVRLLAQHPHVQQKIHQELIDRWDSDQSIAYEQSKRFPYLEAVIREALRLYPPIPLVGRCTSADFEYSKRGEVFRIPKGVNVAIPIYFLQRNPSFYDQPERFDPDRFLDLEAIKDAPWLVFSGGPRNCIGWKFAMCELKIAVAHLCRAFEFRPTKAFDSRTTFSDEKHQDLRLGVSISLTSSKPISVQIKART